MNLRFVRHATDNLRCATLKLLAELRLQCLKPEQTLAITSELKVSRNYIYPSKKKKKIRYEINVGVIVPRLPLAANIRV